MPLNNYKILQIGVSKLPNSLNIAGKEIQPGTKITGTINAGFYFPNQPKDYIRKVVKVPYTVICGQQDGPTLCITGGMDPTEYAAITAAIKLHCRRASTRACKSAATKPPWKNSHSKSAATSST